MTRLVPILLLCACGGSLIDHNSPALTNGTPACEATCTTSVPGASPLCIGSTCTYQCPDGWIKSAGACHQATSLAAGASHTCAVVAGEAHCWGANGQGQLGGTPELPYVPVQAAVTGNVTAVAAGSSHSCAIADGFVWCWGDNTYGQLGLGTMGGTQPSPQKVPNFSGAVLLAAGGSHTCAVNGSETRCWGRNDSGQLGDGTNLSKSDPTAVSGLGVAISISAGVAHTCAVTTSGTSCWGDNGAGQLGINQSGASYSTPQRITSSSLNGATFVGLGANHSCGGDPSFTLNCWGANASRQLGDGSTSSFQPSPQKTSLSAKAVTGGIGHTCAIANDDSLKCWGLDSDGQLGVPAGSAGTGAVDVPGLSGVQKVAAGSKHTCAIANNGNTYCWGLNGSGQLGVDPTSTPSTAAPALVSGR